MMMRRRMTLRGCLATNRGNPYFPREARRLRTLGLVEYVGPGSPSRGTLTSVTIVRRTRTETREDLEGPPWTLLIKCFNFLVYCFVECVDCTVFIFVTSVVSLVGIGTFLHKMGGGGCSVFFFWGGG